MTYIPRSIPPPGITCRTSTSTFACIIVSLTNSLDNTAEFSYFQNPFMHTYYVYIMANKSRSTLYIGVTNGLTKRVLQHREAKISGFTKSYHCNRLVYFETFTNVVDAINRETQMKKWGRNKKDQLIAGKNPTCGDLAVSVLGLEPAPATKWE